MFVGRETGKYLHDIDVDYDRLAGSHRFLDDYIKVFKKDKEGLHGRFKIVGQVGLGLIVGLTLFLSPDVVIRENVAVQTPGADTEVVKYESENIKSTQTTIPFFKNNNLDYADLVPFLGEHAQTGGWVIFILLTIFVVTAVSNGANLTDGLDGLATGTSAIMGLTLGILAYLSGHIAYASYLNIMYIPGSEELVVFASAFMGATIGFCGIMHSRLRCLWAIRVASRWAVLLPCSLFVYIRSC